MKNTCRNCKYRERWECGSKIISYCSKRHSNRTNNGLLKVKCNSPACLLFEQQIKSKHYEEV